MRENNFKSEPTKEAVFDQKKTKYFSQLALSVKSAFEVHKEFGQLRESGSDLKRPWGNVSEHCLVEVARAKVLSDLIGLGEELKNDLQYAAALHDVSKRREKEMPVAKDGITWQQYHDEVSEWSNEQLKKAEFSDRIIDLSDSMGHEPLNYVKELLDRDQGALTDFEKAYLLMHYVDGYTRGSDWVIPAVDGKNEIDLRAEKNKVNPTLKNLQEDGKKIYDGQNYNDVMQEVGHKIEHLFAGIINSKTNETIEPIKIPEFVDQKIIEEIEVLS